VWVKDLRTGSLTKVTFGNVLDYRPHWFADDSALAFVAPRPPEQLAWDLYTVPASGGVDSLVLDLTNEIREGFFSPDGEWLVFQQQVADYGDLGAVRLGASETPIALTNTRTIQESDLELSPDGLWLAYESNAIGRPEVFVRRFPDTTATAQVSLEGGEQPVWGRNGRELFYLNSREELVVAEVTTGTSFTIRNRGRSSLSRSTDGILATTLRQTLSNSS
jgi:Tol biopolymer transport system component